MTTQTFIFVHDQNIVLDYIRVNKFNSLKNLTYIFLGNGDTSKIINNPNVVICRDLPINIEEYPKLTSFSGWYAIWKNKLYNQEFINLFEYDINLSTNFDDIINTTLTSNPSIIGYIPFSPHDYRFIKHSQWSIDLINSIKKNYNIDVLDVINNLPGDTVCSMTSNHTFSKNLFEKYMEWMEPMIEDIKNSHLSGHQAERSISLFYLLEKIENIKVIPNILEHFQFDSHKTQGISESHFINNYNKLL